MKILGKDIILMYQLGGKWSSLAFGTSADINVSCETKEISNPYIGKWPRNKKGRYSWSASSGHLLAEGRQRIDLVDKLKAGDNVRICFASVTADDEVRKILGYTPDGRFGLVGDAQITKLTISARKGDYVTMSVEFVGFGKLQSI